jgi:hypothetical protein
VTESPSPDLVAMSHLTNAIPTTITVGSATGLALIDTGDPWALLDPARFPSVASLGTTGGTIPSVVIAGETVSNPYVYSSTLGDLSEDPTLQIYANVGGTVLDSFIPSLNYRDATFTLDGASTPTGLLAPTTLDFLLKGGDGTSNYPPSRIVVTVSVEGTDYAMIVDTGASDVTLSQRAFTALTSDGRVQIAAGVDTTSGMTSSSLTRAASVAIGSVSVGSVVIAHDTSFDMNLASVSMDAGETIDGSLGGTFLHDFYVTIDYANEKLTLARYSDLSFIIDQGEHIGITLGIEGTNTYVVTAATGDAAKKGATVGDVLVAIDGTGLASIGELQVAALLYGAVGSTRLVKFGAATTLANMSVPILVEESLPLPAGK